jgi:hypothetical protein
VSLTIWTQCAGDQQIAALRVHAFRVVESQHMVSTMALSDDLESQHLLEALIDTAKPAEPESANLRAYDWLLRTPFRYRPPLHSGSRFGSALERAVWYGSERIETAIAEKVYHQMRFLRGTGYRPDVVQVEWASFEIGIYAERGVDLTRPPFDAHERRISDPGSYGASQPLGTAMREAGVQAFAFRSARDPERGRNLGVFEPGAFAANAPDRTRAVTWRCAFAGGRAEVVHKNALTLGQTMHFFEGQFSDADGRFHDPGTA